MSAQCNQTPTGFYGQGSRNVNGGRRIRLSNTYPRSRELAASSLTPSSLSSIQHAPRSRSQQFMEDITGYQPNESLFNRRRCEMSAQFSDDESNEFDADSDYGSNYRPNQVTAPHQLTPTNQSLPPSIVAMLQ